MARHSTNKNLISTNQARELSGYTSSYLTRLVRSGEVEAVRSGHSWLIDPKSLKLFIEAQAKRKEQILEERSRAIASEYHANRVPSPVMKVAEPVVPAIPIQPEIPATPQFDIDKVASRISTLTFSTAALAMVVGVMALQSTNFSQLARVPGQVAAAIAAPTLSVGEHVALATYQTIHDLMASTSRTLASLFAPNSGSQTSPTLAVGAPTSGVGANLVSTTSSPKQNIENRISNIGNASPTTSPFVASKPSTVITGPSYPTYVTTLNGVSVSDVTQLLASERSSILATVSGMISPVSSQVATNIQTIQMVNKIEDLTGLIVRNGDFRGGTFSGGTFSGGVSVSSLLGDFTTLTASDFTSGTIVATGALTTYTSATAPFFVATSTTATSTFAGGFTVGTDKFVVDSTTGNVGIGTTSPAYRLDMQTDDATSPSVIARIKNTNSTGMSLFNFENDAGASGSIGIGGSAQSYLGGAQRNRLTISNWSSGLSLVAGAGDLRFYTNGWGSGYEKMIIANSGNIGIGTTSPDSLLALQQTVNGVPIISAYRTTDSAPSGDFINYKTKAGTTLFRVDNSGNLLAGGIVNSGSQTITSTSQPQFRLQYDPTNELTFSTNSTGSTTLAINGTAPGLSFTPQSNLVNTFNFTNAASNSVLSIDTLNQRVGIGTTTPAYKLSILEDNANVGVANGYGQLSLAGVTTPSKRLNLGFNTTNNYGWIQSGEDNVAYRALALNPLGGNVGIGTTSPSQLLTVGNNNQFMVASDGSLGIGLTPGGVQARVRVLATPSVNPNGIEISDNTTSNLLLDLRTGGSMIGPTTATYLGFQTNNAERIRINSAGNVGVGSTTPWGQLSVNPNGITGPAFVIGSSTATNFIVTNGGNVGIGTTNPGAQLAISSGYNATNFLVTDPAGASKISITTSGGVGNDIASLNLYNNNNSVVASLYQQYGWLNISGPSGGNGIILNTNEATPLVFKINNTEAVRIINGGNVGIGTTTPDARLTINGTDISQYSYSLKVKNSAGTTTLQVSNNDIVKIGYKLDATTPIHNVLLNFIESTNDPLLFIGRDMNSGGTGYPYSSINFGSYGFQNQHMFVINGGNSKNVSNLQFVVNQAQADPTLGYSNGSFRIIRNQNTGNFSFGIDTSDRAYIQNYANGAAAALNLNPLGGNVGIGTTNPQQPLDISVSADKHFRITQTSTNNTGIEIARNDGVNNTSWQLYQPGGSTDFRLYNGSDKVTFQAGGNVGVGSTTPWGQLSVNPNGITGPAFVVGSSTATNFIVTNGGNVGIGTASPGADLDIRGTATGALGSGLLALGNADGAPWQFRYTAGADLAIDRNNGGWSNVMYWDVDAGNVGIGTASPGSKLNVILADGTSEILSTALNAEGAKVGLEFNYNSGTGGNTNNLARILANTQSMGGGDLLFQTASSGSAAYITKMTLLRNGNVGIGTLVPDNKLQINATSATTSESLLRLSGGSNGFSGPNDAGTGYSIVFDATAYNGTIVQRDGAKIEMAKENTWNEQAGGSLRGALVFYTGAGTVTSPTLTEKMRISSAGNVGIGETSPVGKLNLKLSSGSYAFPATSGTTQSAGLVQRLNDGSNSILDIGGNAGYGFWIQSTDKTNLALNLPLLLNLNGGNVGVGTTSPWGQLSVNPNGITGPAFVVGSSTATNFIVTNGGNVGIGTAGPTQKLEVDGATIGYPASSGSTQTNGVLRVGSTVNFGAIDMGGNGSAGNWIQSVNTSNLALKYPLLINPNGGNVAIGTGTLNADNFDTLSVFVSAGTNSRLTVGRAAATDHAALLFSDIGNAYRAGIGMLESSNNLSFVTGGVFSLANEKMRITSTGNVGIGTTSPWGQLSVNPNGITGPAFVVGSSTATNFIVTNGGNVGIGTANPGSSLHIGAGTGVRLTTNADDTFPTITTAVRVTGGEIHAQGFNSPVSDYGTLILSAGGESNLGSKMSLVLKGMGGTDNTQARFLAGNTPLMTILNTGNVGIGTTNPIARLTVATTTAGANELLSLVTSYSTQNTAQSLTWRDATNITGQIDTRYNGTTVDMFLGHLYNSGYQTGDLVTIKGSGNVGIGTTSPYTKLSISDGTNPKLVLDTAGNNSTSPSIVLTGNLGESGEGFRLLYDNIAGDTYFNNIYSSGTNAFHFQSGGTDRVTIQSAGNVGIGTTNPGQKLDVAGFINTDQYSGYKQAGNTVLYASTTNNTLAVGASAAAAWMSASSTQWYSVAIGSGALATTPTNAGAQYNTALGYDALISNTTGSQNNAIGTYALRLNTTGTYNSAIGVNALHYNTTGSNNTAIGRLSLYTNVSGSNNIAIGSYALESDAAANSMVAIGYFAGYLSSNVQGGTYLGYQSGYSATTGADYNTLLGYNSGAGVTTGARNVLIGQSTISPSWNQVTTGSNNIAIGNDVAVASPTASNQLNIGNLIYGTGLSGTGATLSTGNIGIGTTTPQYKLDVNGDVNVAAGSAYKYNGANVITASTTLNNYFFAGAGNSTATGVNNLGQGPSALANVTTGWYNIAIGLGALTGNTVGYNNVGIGYAALNSNPGGYGNTAIGYSSLQNNNSSDNTAIGLGSGKTLFGGYQNTFLGNGADVTSAASTTLINSIAIGYGTIVSASNQAILGNTSITQTLLRGNVGIGTTNPGYKLDVAGFINTDQYSGYKQAGNTILYASTTNQSVAVGASSAAAWMSASSTPWYSVAVGPGALGTAPTSGGAQYNTALGYNALISNTAGAHNTANGYGALVSNTVGTMNTAFGSRSLVANTTGSYNTAVGYEALLLNTTGSYNTSSGIDSLYSNTTGGGNVATGYAALFVNSTGSNNAAYGSYASFRNTSATSSTAVGYSAAYGAAGVYANQGGVYLGYQSGYSAATGSDYNTLLGYQSGYGVTSGARNVLIGQSTIAASYNQVTTGSNNIAIGNDVAVASPTASNQLNIGNLIYGTGLSGTGSTLSSGNVGIGTTSPSQALSVQGNGLFSGNISAANITATGTMAFGTTTLTNLSVTNTSTSSFAGPITVQGLTVGKGASSLSANTVVGVGAGASFTTSNNNVAIGAYALVTANATGDRQVAVGPYALYSADNYLNTGVGYLAGAEVTSGSENVFIGGYARGITTGAQNTFIGASTGGGGAPSSGTGSVNTFVGYASGGTVMTSAFNNTAVGGYAFRSITTGSYNVLMGLRAGYSISSGSNNVIIGGTDGAGDSALSTGSGNTIIGQQAGVAVTGGNNVMLGYRAGSFETGSNSFYIDNRSRTNTAGDKAGALLYGTFSATPASQTLVINASTTVAQNLTVQGTGNSSFAGNVGIGTTSPGYKLDVQNGANSTQIHFGNNGDVGGYLMSLGNSNFNLTGGTAYNGANWIAKSTGASIVAGSAITPGDINFYTDAGLTTGNAYTPSARMTILNSGNVGIGTTTPWGQLSVNPNGISGPAFVIGSSTVTNFIVTNGGNVGVGTTNPLAQLNIRNAAGVASGPGQVGNNGLLIDSGGAEYGLSIFSGGKGASGSGFGWLTNVIGVNTYYDQVSDTLKRYASSGGFTQTQAIVMGSDSNQVGGNRIGFWAGNNMDPIERMSISSSGNVGIGTSSPDMLLSVGSATPTGSVAHFENSTGSCYINPTTTSLSCSSDIRLKYNLNAISTTTALAGVEALSPTFYNWNSEAAGTAVHAGFIAQEVQLIFPDLVSTGPDGFYALNYAGLTPYLTAAVQGLSEKIDLQDTRLTSLESRLAALESGAVSSASGSPLSLASTTSQLVAWFADAGNGIGELFANRVHTKELCVSDDSGSETCVTRARLDALLSGSTAAVAGGVNTSSTISNSQVSISNQFSSSNDNASTTPPLSITDTASSTDSTGSLQAVTTTTATTSPQATDTAPIVIEPVPAPVVDATSTPITITDVSPTPVILDTATTTAPTI